MRFTFRDNKLRKLYESEHGAKRWPPELVKLFFQVMGVIASASDLNDIRSFKSLRLEKLKGNRQHQHSLRLNDRWRLIIEIDSSGTAVSILVVEIVDYH